MGPSSEMGSGRWWLVYCFSGRFKPLQSQGLTTATKLASHSHKGDPADRVTMPLLACVWGQAALQGRLELFRNGQLGTGKIG